jgi:hypothetical protein
MYFKVCIFFTKASCNYTCTWTNKQDPCIHGVCTYSRHVCNKKNELTGNISAYGVKAREIKSRQGSLAVSLIRMDLPQYSDGILEHFAIRAFCYQGILLSEHFAIRAFCYQSILLSEHFAIRAFYYQSILLSEHFAMKGKLCTSRSSK